MSDSRWGGDDLLWGSDDLLWGAGTIVLGDSELIAHWSVIAEFPSGEKVAVWTGRGDLTFGGDTFVGVGPSLIEISGMAATSDNQDLRTQISLLIIDDDLKSQFLQDPGLVRITLRVIYSTDGANTWRQLPRKVIGYLSSPVIRGGSYVFELATMDSDADRGRPKLWSNQAQQQEYPGDLGFEHTIRIAGGVELGWPPS